MGKDNTRLAFYIMSFCAGCLACFGGTQAAMLPKLLPNDVQATFQTGRSALYQFFRAFVPMIFAQILAATYPTTSGTEDQKRTPADWATYPLDAMPVVVALCIGLPGIGILFANRAIDPKAKIEDHSILEDYYGSDYAQSEHYKTQGSGGYSATLLPSTTASLH